MKTIQMMLIAGTTLSLATAPAHAKEYDSNPNVGNSTLLAVFDAPLGERISAVSSAVACKLDVDTATGVAKGTCSVPLTSIEVDNESTKTKHFQQWATNKESPPDACRLELTLDAKALGPLEPKTPVDFAFDGAFEICGRGNARGAKEHIHGTVIRFPAGTYGSAETLRIRAHIDAFNREDYHVGPKWTGGWLARVQQLASVVAAEGTIDVNIFATAAK